MDLFFVQGFSFLAFLKNLGFVGYVLLFLHSRNVLSLRSYGNGTHFRFWVSAKCGLMTKGYILLIAMQ